jgi:hypothetical protein
MLLDEHRSHSPALKKSFMYIAVVDMLYPVAWDISSGPCPSSAMRSSKSRDGFGFFALVCRRQPTLLGLQSGSGHCPQIAASSASRSVILRSTIGSIASRLRQGATAPLMP